MCEQTPQVESKEEEEERRKCLSEHGARERKRIVRGWDCFRLTGVCDVEEERHRHHCGAGGGAEGDAVSLTLFERRGRTIGEAERYQEERKGRHAQARVQRCKGG